MSIDTLNTAFRDQMTAYLSAQPNHGQDAISQEALARFSERGLPTRRGESWRYTDLSRFLNEVPPASDNAKADHLPEDAFADIKADVTFVIDNGYFRPEWSSSEQNNASYGVSISGVSDGEEATLPLSQDNSLKDDTLVDLNMVMTAQERQLNVKINHNKPVKIRLRHIIGTSQAVSTYHRLTLSVVANTNVEILETFEAQGMSSFSNMVTDIHLGAEAKVSHSRIGSSHGVGEGVLISSLSASLDQASNYALYPIMLGGLMERFQLAIDFVGEHSNFTLNGAAMLKDQDHNDLTLTVCHHVPHCNSNELYKLVLDDAAMGVFQGKVIVDKGAQKTEGEMMARALLLGDKVRFRGKPELEIFADDVVCGHGATSAALDPAEVYYLRSRGIGKAEAQAMLTEAFLNDVLGELPDEILRDHLANLFRERL